jgi:hypothetical protein
VARAEQIGDHGRAHIAQADECDVGHVVSSDRISRSKSFLVLFFKKELLFVLRREAGGLKPTLRYHFP